MGRTITIRQGDATWLAGVTGLAGEMLWETDNNDLYVGTGAANIFIGGASGLLSIGDIQDVTITGVADGEILVWNSGSAVWENQTLAEAGVGTSTITMLWRVLTENTALATGDGKGYLPIPSRITGWNLTDIDAELDTVSSSGAVSIALYNSTDTVDMLSVNLTIDQNEYSSYTAATPPTIDTTHDDVATADRLRCDIDDDGTGAKGLVLILTFEQA